MNIGLKAVLALTFLGASLPAQETPVLESEVDKVNYGIGVGVARNFGNQGLEVDLELVIRGMRDAHAGAPLLLTEEELARTMNAFQKELRRRQAEAFQAASEKNLKEGEAFLAANAGWAAEAPTLPLGQARGSGLRLSPYRDGTDGFFIARLEKA